MIPAIYKNDNCTYYAIPHLSRPEPYLHREDGPAIEWRGGDKNWYQYNVRHRLGAPAIEHDSGTKEWWVNGKLHRLDGPAIEYVNGDELWYVEGERINCNSQEEFERLIKMKAFW